MTSLLTLGITAVKYVSCCLSNLVQGHDCRIDVAWSDQRVQRQGTPGPSVGPQSGTQAYVVRVRLGRPEWRRLKVGDRNMIPGKVHIFILSNLQPGALDANWYS